MEHLTIRNSDGTVSQPADLKWAEALKKLAAYEDTGLEPEEAEACKVALMGKTLAEIKEIEGLSIERMKELAKAEAEDRLLILPCKVGDTVYLIKQVMIGTKSIFDARVNGISVSYAGDVILHFGGHPPVSYCASSIGETIFLTRAEAEAALRKEADG